MRLSKQPQKPEYRAIDASITPVVSAGAADTKRTPFGAHLYSLVALLVVTLGLIAVGVVLNRKLPEGSESEFVLAGTNKAVTSAVNRRGLSQRDKAIWNAAEATRLLSWEPDAGSSDARGADTWGTADHSNHKRGWCCHADTDADARRRGRRGRSGSTTAAAAAAAGNDDIPWDNNRPGDNYRSRDANTNANANADVVFFVGSSDKY
ncbi:hypothetical protein LY78DRAFT_726839 [Colletotrichum sublineola]|nr:hypothetical protein LY78DRAFT_726839 [Colletotrichum sublineola]